MFQLLLLLTVLLTSKRVVALVNSTSHLSAVPSAANYAGYLFAYVRCAVAFGRSHAYLNQYHGDSIDGGENLYLAVSNGNEIKRWTEVNNGKPCLVSNIGTTGVRDPFLVRSPYDSKFWLLATVRFWHFVFHNIC
jgi:hypothetical protein